jgi:hypothetical protein
MFSRAESQRASTKANVKKQPSRFRTVKDQESSEFTLPKEGKLARILVLDRTKPGLNEIKDN